MHKPRLWWICSYLMHEVGTSQAAASATDTATDRCFNS